VECAVLQIGAVRCHLSRGSAAATMSGVRNPEASPGRYVRRRDEIDCDDVLGVDVEAAGADPFDIPAKRAPVERLRRWRVSTEYSSAPIPLRNLNSLCPPPTPVPCRRGASSGVFPHAMPLKFWSAFTYQFFSALLK
jgi:hypothetical protein